MKISHTMKLFLILLITCYSQRYVSFGFPSQYSILGNDDLDTFHTEKQAFRLFQRWRKEHKRIYPNSEEGEKRFQIFQRNLKYISETNAKRRSPHEYRLGLNKFADMSPEEFRQVYLKELQLPTASGDVEVKNDDSCNAPASLDWRDKGVVTRVKDQQQCGSCSAFTATGTMESINAIVTGNLIELSEQQLMDCDTESNSCDGGWYHDLYDWVRSNGGIDTEANYPYTANEGICNTTGKNKVVTIDGYTNVSRSEEALLCAVAKQPVSVALDASGFQYYSKTSEIYGGQNCSNEPNNITHAVVIVGYGHDSVSGMDYWIVKNSWGADWGMNGYMFIRRNTGLPNGVCAINAWAAYPTKAISSSAPLSAPSSAPTISPMRMGSHHF